MLRSFRRTGTGFGARDARARFLPDVVGWVEARFADDGVGCSIDGGVLVVGVELVEVENVDDAFRTAIGGGGC